MLPLAGMEGIKRARQKVGLSLTELAEATGLHRTAIARVEREGQDVKASTVALIAKALGVPVCELFEETGHGRRGRK
jgi:transcriptional regulator with XRE-family HTH domain